MAKLQMKDLTPELLAEMKDFENGEQVKDFLASRGLEVSDHGAEVIAEQLKEGEIDLSPEQLEAISGGCSGVECCPKCGSKNLQTHPYTLLDHELTYDVVCLDCHYRW